MIRIKHTVTQTFNNDRKINSTRNIGWFYIEWSQLKQHLNYRGIIPYIHIINTFYLKKYVEVD